MDYGPRQLASPPVSDEHSAQFLKSRDPGCACRREMRAQQTVKGAVGAKPRTSRDVLLDRKAIGHDFSSPAARSAWFGKAYYTEEAPVHRVTVDGFWIDRTPVTNREFS